MRKLEGLTFFINNAYICIEQGTLCYRAEVIFNVNEYNRKLIMEEEGRYFCTKTKRFYMKPVLVSPVHLQITTRILKILKPKTNPKNHLGYFV